MFRNAGSAGMNHRQLRRKHRRQRDSDGPAGPCRSLIADPEAIAVAQASAAEKPIVPVQRRKPSKVTDLSNPNDCKLAEKIANSLIGEEPITSETPLIKRPHPAQKGCRRPRQ